VEREKLHRDEILTKTVDERASLDRSLQRLEEDNIDLQRQLQALQSQLAQAETEHSQKLVLMLHV
jgi:chromosome segregation ATPase